MAQTLDGISDRLKGTPTMEKISLTALAREQLETARAASSGRSAHTVYGGHEHSLRQTLMAMTANLPDDWVFSAFSIGRNQLPYAAMAVLGEADALWEALRVANPVDVAGHVANASPRQRNAYFSSSDAAFPDRYRASAEGCRARKAPTMPTTVPSKPSIGAIAAMSPRPVSQIFVSMALAFVL